MNIKTNVVLNKVNANGRIYPEGQFEKALDKYLEGHAGIYEDSASAANKDMMKLVSIIDGYKVIDGELTITGKFLGHPNAKTNEMMYNNGLASVTSAGYGKVNADGVVEDFKLTGFFMIPSEN